MPAAIAQHSPVLCRGEKKEPLAAFGAGTLPFSRGVLGAVCLESLLPALLESNQESQWILPSTSCPWQERWNETIFVVPPNPNNFRTPGFYPTSTPGPTPRRSWGNVSSQRLPPT